MSTNLSILDILRTDLDFCIRLIFYVTNNRVLVWILSEDLIGYLERLVLIKFSDSERKRISAEVDKIVSLFNELKNIEDLDRYEPLFHVHEISSPLREDEALDKVDEKHDMLRGNALLVHGYVKAPKTMVE